MHAAGLFRKCWQRRQAVDMVDGFQRQFLEVMQNVVAGMKGAGKGGTQEILKAIPKPIIYKM